MPVTYNYQNKKTPGRHADAVSLLFFHSEYVKRRFLNDIYKEGPFTADQIDEVEHRISETVANLPPEQACSFVQTATALMHNICIGDPKYVFDTTRLSVPFQQIYPYLNYMADELTFFAAIAHHYGFFVGDLFSPMPGEDILEYILINNGTPEPPSPFPRQNSDANDPCQFYYSNSYGVQYFTVEGAGNIYIYISEEELKNGKYQEAIKILPGKIKSAANKKISRYGAREQASIQICIRKPVKHIPEIQELCRITLKQYVDVIILGKSPETLPDSEIQQLMWCIYGKKGDHINLQERAIGLWMWDLVNYQDKSAYKAAEIIIGSDLNHCRKLGEHVKKQLYRDLENTDNYIQTMTY